MCSQVAARLASAIAVMTSGPRTASTVRGPAYQSDLTVQGSRWRLAPAGLLHRLTNTLETHASSLQMRIEVVACRGQLSADDGQRGVDEVVRMGLDRGDSTLPGRHEVFTQRGELQFLCFPHALSAEAPQVQLGRHLAGTQPAQDVRQLLV